MGDIDQLSELVEQLLLSRQQELRVTMKRVQHEAWSQSNAYLARLDSDQMPLTCEKDDASSGSSQHGQRQSHGGMVRDDGYGGMSDGHVNCSHGGGSSHGDSNGVKQGGQFGGHSKPNRRGIGAKRNNGRSSCNSGGDGGTGHSFGGGKFGHTGGSSSNFGGSSSFGGGNSHTGIVTVRFL